MEKNTDGSGSTGNIETLKPMIRTFVVKLIRKSVYNFFILGA